MTAFSIHPGARMGPVHLTVSDVERSLGFYGTVLGFAPLWREGDAAALGAEGEDPLVVLHENPRAARRPPRTAGLYHFALLLPTRADLARSLRRLGETGYPLGGCSDHSVSEALYLDDPDGNGIELYRDRPREAWEYPGGRLRITTDPLDLDGLLAEADGRPWSGLPAGTVIGHVHLHVPDLDGAERFFGEGLGFDVMSRYRGGASFLSAGGYHHHIGVNVWAGEGASPAKGDASGLRLFTLLLPERGEADRLAGHLEETGVPFEDREGGLLLPEPSGGRVYLTAEAAPGAARCASRFAPG